MFGKNIERGKHQHFIEYQFLRNRIKNLSKSSHNNTIRRDAIISSNRNENNFFLEHKIIDKYNVIKRSL